MESAIHVVATEGIHKATTKAIANHSGVNEVYIYRLFEDKDDLFAQTFALIDSELIACILKYEPIMNMQGIEIEERCYIFFKSCWRNILDYDKCSFFIKYNTIPTIAQTAISPGMKPTPNAPVVINVPI